MAYIGKRKQRWKVEIRKLGFKRISKTFADKDNARKWAKMIESEMERGIYEEYAHNHSVSFKSLLIKYRDEKTANKKSVKSETYKINWLIRHSLLDLPVMRFKSHHIYSLINELKNKNKKPQTIKHYVQLLQVCWNTARKEWNVQVPNTSPFALVTLDKVNNQREYVLSLDEYNRLLDAAGNSKFNYMRDLIIFAYETGARYSEIIKLNKSDVVNKLATFRDTKNGEDRTVPLSDKALEVLSKYPFGQTYFNGIDYHDFYEEFVRVRNKASLPNFRFHDLRSCFCSNAILSGFSIAETAVLSGHKSYAMLKKYVRIKGKDLANKINSIENKIVDFSKIKKDNIG